VSGGGLIAMGMGVDKRNQYAVIKKGCPAGRDKKEKVCVW